MTRKFANWNRDASPGGAKSPASDDLAAFDNNDNTRIDAELDAAKRSTPEQRLRALGEFMRFIEKHMTPGGRAAFLAEHKRNAVS